PDRRPDRRLDRREVVTRLVPGAALALAAAGWAGERPAGAEGGRRPLALVYRGKAGCTGCSEAVRTMLVRDPARYRVRYCGPGQEVPVTARTLAAADLYVQPGGGTDLAAAWRAVRPFAGTLRRWVHGGGHYVGICMGGFLAGFDPGYGLLPGDSGEYAGTPGATVHGGGDTLVTVRWRGHDRTLYFQGGPYFTFRPGAGVTVLATYTNGLVAAAVARHGAGSVGVVGPHPEAPARWYREAGLSHPHETQLPLGFDLVRTTVAATAPAARR
ncbi:MAG: BPL-N domain-containing protein, partial [Acidimicrobiales bacterium]